MGDEVDRLRRSPDKNDLVGRWRVEKATHFFSCVLIRIGGPRGQFMRGTMNIGVFVLVEVCQAIDDGLGLLCGGGIVQPDQWAPVYPLVQNREVAPHGIGVKRGCAPNACIPGIADVRARYQTERCPIEEIE